MPPRVTLVDICGSLATAAQAVGWGVNVRAWTDIRDIDIAPGTAFVSPANSLGFMDGGIDYTLSRLMFPGVEARVKRAIADEGVRTLLGRPFLPIGRTVIVPTQHRGVSLISAPTMWLPQVVQKTHNPYHAMYAIMRDATSRPEITNVVVPGLCTGCGEMPAEDAVKLMTMAHDDFLAGRPPRWTLQQIVDEQPNYYQNTEFKPVSPADVQHC